MHQITLKYFFVGTFFTSFHGDLFICDALFKHDSNVHKGRLYRYRKQAHCSQWGRPSDPLIVGETLDSHSSAIVRWTTGDGQMDSSAERTKEHRKLPLKTGTYSTNIYRNTTWVPWDDTCMQLPLGFKYLLIEAEWRIGLHNGLSFDRRQAIIWASTDVWPTGLLL